MISYRLFTKRFGAQRAVEELSLEVARGEVVALLGPNGSGKTTTLKAAAGLIRPTSGTVTLGDPPRPSSDPEARRVLSYLPQKVSFPDALTGHEVVEFYRELRGAPAERGPKVLRFASLNGAGERTVGTYSGGMTQRLGLAVAMIPEAPVFLLDEPTAALDPDGLCAFYGLVERAREDGRAVLFTSHQLGDAERLADRFAVLVGGRLVADLGASELKDRLAERGVMRLRVGGRPAGLLDAVRALAPAAAWAGGARDGAPSRDEELVVPGPAALRPAVLDAVRAQGVEVRGLTADEGRLDALYRELVAESEGTAHPGENGHYREEEAR
ncbi:MAG TPA: ABC transporter ATP-binding protein [Vicinamibacteria bacterium]